MSVKFGISIGLAVKGIEAIGNAIKGTTVLDTKISKLKANRLNLAKEFGFANSEAKKLGGTILKLTRNAKLLNKTLKINNNMQEYRDKFKSGFVEKMAIGASVIAPLKVAIDFESAMADVKKVVNFDSNDELKEFQNQITKLSTTIPLSANGLAQIVASGGQLGIAKDKLIDFTTTTAKMSTAFDMMPSEAGEASAKLMNIFGLSVKGVGSLGDAINHLSDNSAAKARDIVNVLARVGGSAKVFGISAKSVASLAGGFLALGKEPETAGTAINAMLLKLGTADKQGKKFQDALAMMGLSASELKQNIKKDGEGAIVDFLQRINSIDKDSQMGVLSDLFGAEYSDDIALLSGGIENYTKSIKLLNKEQNYSGSMQKEFEARSATTQNNLKLLGNTISVIAINFGSVLLPAVNSVLTPLKDFSTFVGGVVSEYPTISKYFGGFVAGAVGLSLALSGIGFVGSFVVGGIMNIARAGLFLNSVFLANPVGLMIVGITALIGLGALLYNKFEPFKKLIDSIVDGVGSVIKSVGGFFGFGDDEEEKKKTTKNRTENIEENKITTTHLQKTKLEPINNIGKVLAPIALGTTLAVAQPAPAVQYQKLDIPQQTQVNHKSVKSIQNTNKSSSNRSVVKNYTINISVSGGNVANIKDEVKRAIKEIEDEEFERGIEDVSTD